MRDLLLRFTVLTGALLAGSAAQAAASIDVDLSTQTMEVHSAEGDYSWPISSARDGYVTPDGTYGVQRLEAMHLSHKYHNSPMPHSIFFHGGYAIHGTYEIAELGEPASHGCIRLAPRNAAVLYGIVKAEGARITITGSSEPDASYAQSEEPVARTQRVAAQRDETEFGYTDAPNPAPRFSDWQRAPSRYSRPRSMDYNVTDDDDPWTY